MKSKVQGANAGRLLPAGVHPVTITEFKGLRDDKGNYITNKNGAQGFSVTFECKGKGKFTETFWYSRQTMWRLRKLFKAILLVDNVIQYKAIIGQELWLYIAQEYINDDRTRRPDVFNLVIFDFSPMTESRSKPLIKGDPDDNNGVASEVFVIERHLELKTIEMPKPIEGDTIAFMQEGITPNVSFTEDIEEHPMIEIEEEEGF